MTTREVYRHTKRFVGLKLLLSFLMMIVIGSTVYLFVGLALFFTQVSLIMWIIIGLIVILLLLWIGDLLRFRLRAAHVATVVGITTSDELPEQATMVTQGLARVNEKGLGIIGFYFLFRLSFLAARQIATRVVSRTDQITANLPGGFIVQKFKRYFIKSVIKSAPEAILAWNFFRRDEPAVAATVNGTRIYFKHFPRMLISGIKTSIMVVIAYGIAFLIMIGTAIFALIAWNIWILLGSVGVILAVRLIKTAFIDSLMMVRVVHSFMQLAPETQLSDTDLQPLRSCPRYRKLERKAAKLGF